MKIIVTNKLNQLFWWNIPNITSDISYSKIIFKYQTMNFSILWELHHKIIIFWHIVPFIITIGESYPTFYPVLLYFLCILRTNTNIFIVEIIVRCVSVFPMKWCQINGSKHFYVVWNRKENCLENDWIFTTKSIIK